MLHSMFSSHSCTVAQSLQARRTVLNGLNIATAASGALIVILLTSGHCAQSVLDRMCTPALGKQPSEQK